MALIPNILSNFESYSYHISFSMAAEPNGKRSKVGPSQRSIIIAETGKTALYYIESLDLETVAPTRGSGTNTNITSGKLVIIEPMGFTFFDRLFTANMQQGWKSPEAAVFHLEVSFNGWGPSGNPFPQIAKHAYRVKVVAIDCDTDQLKSTYTLQLSGFQREPLSEDVISPHRQFRSEIKKKLSASMAEFEKVFNKTATGLQGSTKTNTGLPDQYKFMIGPNLSRLNLDMPIEVEADSTVVQKDGDGKLYYYYTGERIDHAMIKLVSNAKGIAKNMIPNLRSDGSIDFEKTPSAILLKHYTFDMDVSYGAFNPRLGRYQRIYEYTIDIVPRPELEDMPANSNGNIARYAAYIKEGILEKMYQHYFTGKNTEVLSVKFDFSNAYTSYQSAYTHVINEYGHSITEEGRQNEIGLGPFRKGPLGQIFAAFNQLLSVIGFVRNVSGFNSRLLETLPIRSVLKTYNNRRVIPLTSPEKITSGVNTIKNPELSEQLGSIAFYFSQNSKMFVPLITMTLEIRGDPYWLDNNVGEPSQFSRGTKMLYYLSKTAEPANELTGLPFNVGSIRFEGAYHVINVKSNFANGRFTQTLDCTYDSTTIDGKPTGNFITQGERVGA